MRASIFLAMSLLPTILLADDDVRLVTVDPGHFHAGLLQKEMLPGMSPLVHVYAPLGPDLSAHLNRVARFNQRKDNPTRWVMRIYAGPDFLERMLTEKTGNAVVFSGRNRDKIRWIQKSIDARLNVMADKPWIIEGADMPNLERALLSATARRVAAFDGMTQRFEISCILPRELARDREVFGELVPGTPDEPGARMESVHFILKKVAGVPNLRPAWFFDHTEQGEGLTDVGTHLVDLIMWTLFPEQAIDYKTQIKVLEGRRWPTVLTREQFQQATAEPEFPAYLAGSLKDGRLNYFCNNTVRYTIRGIHTQLDIKWDYEAAPGANDTEFALFRGSRSRIEVRQGKAQNYKPEVYVIPNRPADKAAVLAALKRRLAALQAECPVVGAADLGGELQVTIPEKLRIGHEAHFALLVDRFLKYMKNPASMPAWETPNMLAKYYVTTRGVDAARGR